MEQDICKFGAFEFDLRSGELRKFGVKLKLQDQPRQVLLLLLEHAGQPVTREAIQKRLWPDNTYVDFDNAINSAVRKLRDALSDSADNPKFVETLSRRGYRFIAPLAIPAEPEPAPSPTAAPQSQSPKHRRRLLAWSGAVACALLLVGSTLFFRPHLPPQNAGGDDLPPPVPFTTYPGFQWSPAFSPEGSRIAFAWAQPGKRSSNIFVKLIGSGDPVRLTSGQDMDFAPAWSRDGQWVAFIRQKAPFDAAVTLVPALGGRARELSRLSLDISPRNGQHRWSISSSLLAWSVDGRWLLAIEQGRPAEMRQVVRISVETGEKAPTFPWFEGQSPGQQNSALDHGTNGMAVSPDGRRLAVIYTADSPRTALYLVNLGEDMLPTGKPPTSLHFDNSVCDGIAWARDGHSVIVSSNRRGSPEFWRIPVEPPGEPKRLNISDDHPRDVAVSPAGEHFVYTHYATDQNIWRMDLTSTGLRDVAPFIVSTKREITPNYSPDGKRIAFESNRSGSEEIWLVEADGSQPVKVTSFGTGWAGTPRWSPDGRRIAFDNYLAGNWEIYTVPVDGGTPVRVTAGPGSKIRPSWSRDGKWIYYCASGGKGPQIWKKPADDGAAVQVTKGGGCNQMESPDGSTLYYLQGDSGSLWKVPVNGGRETKVMALQNGSAFAMAKSGIYFRNGANSPALQKYDFRTGKQQVLGALPDPIFSMAVSPDERWLLFAKTDVGGSQLMLVEKFR